MCVGMSPGRLLLVLCAEIVAAKIGTTSSYNDDDDDDDCGVKKAAPPSENPNRNIFPYLPANTPHSVQRQRWEMG